MILKGGIIKILFSVRKNKVGDRIPIFVLKSCNRFETTVEENELCHL